MNLVLASLSSPHFTASCCIWEFPSTHYYLTLKTMEMFSWHLFLTDIFSGVSQPEEAMNNFVSLLDHFVQLVLHPLTDLSEDLRGKLWQWQKLHMRMRGRGCPSHCLQEETSTSHRLAKGSQGINLGLNRVNVLHYKICVNTVNGTEFVSSIYNISPIALYAVPFLSELKKQVIQPIWDKKQGAGNPSSNRTNEC